jgi:hypothetical protein
VQAAGRGSGDETNDQGRPHQATEPLTQEVLAGLVERVTFHNAENGFCVLQTKAPDTAI